MGKTTNPPDRSAFNRTVWAIVRQVPEGIVTTYGQIASMIPPPEDIGEEDYRRLAPRWVGDAMEAVSEADNPNIPWWRVINAKGGISMSEQRKAGQQQRRRLRREGVEFDAKERVDFEIVGWAGPDEAFLTERNLLPPKPLWEPPSEENPKQLRLF